MQFQIPQFIETEDKIAGPFTLKQLLYFIGAGSASFILYFLLNSFFLWFFITIILAIAAISFSFLKYNGQPFIKVAFAAFSFLWKPRMFIWKRIPKQRVFEIPEIKIKNEQNIMAKRNILDFKKISGAFEMPSVKKLWSDMTTTKNPIPRREKIAPTPDPIKKIKDTFTAFRKITGEKEVAKRVDYR